MKRLRILLGCLLAASAVLVTHASSHREAPGIASDPAADLTDTYVFRSLEAARPNDVVMIMGVWPFSDPAGAPNFTQFGSDVLYKFNIDNDGDARADIAFEYVFSPPSLPDDDRALFPFGILNVDTSYRRTPPIQSLDDPGLLLSQTYTITMTRGRTRIPITNTTAGPFTVVPPNVGSATIGDYETLVEQGIYEGAGGVRTFAGPRDDGFYVDLGGMFDLVKFRGPIVQDPTTNRGVDGLSGFNVHGIALQVPIELLTRTERLEPATSPNATLGVWATTSRRQVNIRRSTNAAQDFGPWIQVSRLGLPLINEAVIGLADKDRYNRQPPHQDAQFGNYILDPPIAHIVNAATDGAVQFRTPPRNDLRDGPWFRFAPPVAASGTPRGPVADMLRINTGVLPTPLASAHRLGLLGGDPAGFPNGRRVGDDVTDIFFTTVTGDGRVLGDGVNTNDVPFLSRFPYLAPPHGGRDHVHTHHDLVEPPPPPPPPGSPVIVWDGPTFGFNIFTQTLPPGIIAWRLRNPDINHIDGPWALPGVPNPLNLEVRGLGPADISPAFWALPDVCLWVHAHAHVPALFEGHPDPAPGPPHTVSACGHGIVELSFQFIPGPTP